MPIIKQKTYTIVYLPCEINDCSQAYKLKIIPVVYNYNYDLIHMAIYICNCTIMMMTTYNLSVCNCMCRHRIMGV